MLFELERRNQKGCFKSEKEYTQISKEFALRLFTRQNRRQALCIESEKDDKSLFIRLNIAKLIVIKRNDDQL